MDDKKGIFLYPITKEIERTGSNTYIKWLAAYLNSDFNVVNSITGIGILDAFAKFGKTDIFYFNWVEDLPTKRFGLFQVMLLPFLLILCRATNKKIVWFIHNNISHNKRYLFLKRCIIKLMAAYSDLILSHSNELRLQIPREKLKVFHHPIEEYHPLEKKARYDYDLLIWGTVSPYKGVYEFVDFASKSPVLKNLKILIAGKVHSDSYYNSLLGKKAENVEILNKILTEEELTFFFSISRIVLFTYASSSVLSSAALCKSLSFGKEVIAPHTGSFKELGEKDLLYTYRSFAELEHLLGESMLTGKNKIDQRLLIDYVQNTSWPAFAKFLSKNIKGLYYEKVYHLS